MWLGVQAVNTGSWLIMPKVSLEQIGVIHSCFREKFGIPRQPGLVKSATAALELLKPFNREEMVRGLEQFSHIWLVFGFHQTVAEGWKTTIRPPWLGGKKRVGIFASRSPHRPNHLGLSVVKLESIFMSAGNIQLSLSGIDLLDGTPVFDIKPYAPYSDAVLDAVCGYADGYQPGHEVELLDDVRKFCETYRQRTGRDLASLIIEIVAGDPRPSSQKKDRREFGMLLWDVNVRWRIDNGRFVVYESTISDNSLNL